MEFRRGLEDLLNKHNMEKGSSTPDFLLAEFIENMLMAFDISVNNREKWYGRRGVPDKYSIPRSDGVFDYDGKLNDYIKG